MILHQQPDPIPNSRPEYAGSDEGEQYYLAPIDKRRILRKRLLFVLLVGLLVTGLLVGWRELRGNTRASMVPKEIQKSVDFPIYYPNQLPSGYMLDPASFRLAEPGVVLFAVRYGEGKDIVFSEQQQPSNSEMDKFISSYLPLNSALQLPLGQAKVGAYGNAPNIRTIVSLPLHKGPWLIATAPSEVGHEDLVKILQSLTK